MNDEPLTSMMMMKFRGLLYLELDHASLVGRATGFTPLDSLAGRSGGFEFATGARRVAAANTIV